MSSYQGSSYDGFMLKQTKYAAAYERFRSLEEQLRNVREGLSARRKENLELSRQRLARDLKRFTSMKAKLQELLVASDRPQEVLRLLAEAEALATRTAMALAESREVAEKGLVPVEESSAPLPEAASES
ncbi:hypothetical protein AK812_SmicGene30884 [Symbiodinium microadriaticum]|uniref:Uncharacterized protein n=1 Tax=Symbiodinium microadriaticum TaxID=2951 RepID=A0A1Q9CY86_SYMMI|nr:hypothetical protein AK812_SmicGene30884 [Symbiodinium microadriaticum]